MPPRESAKQRRERIRAQKLNEVEHVGPAWVNMGAVADMFPWTHDLPVTTR